MKLAQGQDTIEGRPPSLTAAHHVHFLLQFIHVFLFLLPLPLLLTALL